MKTVYWDMSELSPNSGIFGISSSEVNVVPAGTTFRVMSPRTREQAPQYGEIEERYGIFFFFSDRDELEAPFFAVPRLELFARDREDGVDLVEIFYLLWGQGRQILACLAAGALLALCATRLLVTPLYQAVSSIYIVSASNNSVVNLSDLQIGSQLTADYQELMRSRPLLEDVIRRLELDTTPQRLARQIRITNAANTRILKVTVTSPDPQMAARIANQLVDLARVYLPEVMETDQPNLVETAVAPQRPSSPSYAFNGALGGLAGAVLCCGVLLCRRLLNDTFVTPEEVAGSLGLQPLATIPEAQPEGGAGRPGRTLPRWRKAQS